MIAQAFAGGGEFNAAATAPHQRHAQIGLKPLDPGARRCESQMGTRRTMGDAAAVRHSHEKLKIDQIKTHGKPFNYLPSS